MPASRRMGILLQFFLGYSYRVPDFWLLCGQKKLWHFLYRFESASEHHAGVGLYIIHFKISVANPCQRFRIWTSLKLVPKLLRSRALLAIIWARAMPAIFGALWREPGWSGRWYKWARKKSNNCSFNSIRSTNKWSKRDSLAFACIFVHEIAAATFTLWPFSRCHMSLWTMGNRFLGADFLILMV